MAYFILVLILAVFGFADYFLLTSSASVTRIARGELTDLFGEKLRYSGLTASYFDEVLVLEDAEFFATKEHIKVLSADRAEVRFRGGLGKRIDQVHLDRPRLTLSKRLFAELEKMPEGDPIHEAVSPEELPSLFCRGGTLELIHGDVFDWKFPQAFSIHELSLIPSTGYRYLIHGLLESKRLGTWEIQGFFDLKTEDLDVRLTCERLDF